jgi:excisionase family DNA binding protein
MSSKVWLRSTEAQEYASVSKATIRRWIASGLASYRRGRVLLIKRCDIDEFIEQGCTSRDVDSIVDECLIRLEGRDD